MLHFLLQGRLLWLFLPAVAMAATVITPGSTDDGFTSAAGGSLNLVKPQALSGLMHDRPVECKRPDDPYQFTNSLNRTLPLTPPLPASDFPPGESDVFAFDCYIELPGGLIGFEVCRMQRLFGDGPKGLSCVYPNSTLTSVSQIKGNIGSDLSFVFEVWIDVLGYFKYDLGVIRCSLIDVEKDPCIFEIHTKYLVGQAGIFPEEDADPTKLNLCFKLYATFHPPFSRAKTVNFEKCFLKFDKPDDIAIDALSPEPVFSNSTAAIA